MSYRCSLVAISLLLPFAGAGRGEDVVDVEVEGGRTTRVAGSILDFTGAQLVIRRSSGQEQVIPADRVVDLETVWLADHQQGDGHFDARRYQEALQLYRNSLLQERRAWVQRRIQARIVWCYRLLGRWNEAALAFLALYRSDPTIREFDAIPLAWSLLRVDPTMQQQATQWLSQTEDSVAALIGASWLLTSPRRSLAQNVLRRLATDADPRIAFLAETQLWRTRTAAVSDEETHRWAQRIAQMPASLRPGPFFVLGQAEEAHQRYEQAALAYLRTPILDPRFRTLAAESLLAAGRALEKLNRPTEARTLYRELVEDFPESTAAAGMRTRLEDDQRPDPK